MEHLKRIGVHYEKKHKIAKTGVVGIIYGEAPPNDKVQTIALRADMDAIQKIEKTNCPYASKIPGCMHACGHDGHTAILMGVAELLQRKRKTFSGNVKLIFQPGEESGVGSKTMIEEGVLKSPDVDWIFGLHSWPNLPCGTIGIRKNTMMASSCKFVLEITGKSTHAAYPHKGIDPIAISANIICAFQNIRSRMTSPNVDSVVSVSIIESGVKPLFSGEVGSYDIIPVQFNVLPEVVRLTGTSRALTLELQEEQTMQIAQIAKNISSAFGARSEFKIFDLCPPTINNKTAVDIVTDVASEMLGKENVHSIEHPSMGAEDFSYYLQEGIKGSYFRLGLDDIKFGSTPLHSDCFNFNDNALIPGMVTMAGIPLKIFEEKIYA